MADFSQNKQLPRPGKVVTLVALVLLSVALMFLGGRTGDNGPFGAVRSVTNTIAVPFKYVGSLIASPFHAIGEGMENASADSDDIRALKRENEELRSEIIRLQEYQEENARLTALLQISDAYTLESVGARIIGQSGDTWSRTLTINKGSKDGIEVGMPVMSANGLLGQIESVSTFTSEVRLITDSDSGVACILQTSRAEGILTGSSTGLLYLNYVSSDYTVEVGDAVLTSGLGGIFPKGIVIGEVSDVTKSDLYYTILVEPITRVSTFEEVLVVTGNATDVSISTDVSNVEASGGFVDDDDDDKKKSE